MRNSFFYPVLWSWCVALAIVDIIIEEIHYLRLIVGRGRGRSSWKESNDDWSQDSPHVRHDTSELHRPKDHPRETPSASPRQVQMKEDVINVSVSNHLVGRLGSQTGNEPESQTRERSRKERRDTQNNERQGKRKEQTSPRMIQVKVDSNSGTTEVQVATPERPVESHQHRKEGMQRHDEISVQPLQNNPESDSVVMMDTKSSALPSEGPSSGSSSVKQDLRPLDHHDEESWDDDGSWEDATTSGNESQENLEDIVNQYESDNEENIDAVTEEAETEKNQNDMTTTSLDSHPALTLAEQVTGSTQDPSDAPQDRQQTDSPIPTGSAESSGEENIRSVLEAKELERDDDDDREKTPQADDFCVDTIEEPSLMTETIQNSKTCLGDENSELECHSSEINDDREKTPQPDHLPLQDTVIVENSNNAPTAQSSGIDVEHLSETVQRIELLDGPEDEMGQAVDEKIKPTPIIEGSQLKTAVEVDATVSGNQTDSSNNENQCPNADEDFKNPSEAQDFSLQTKLELETLDQASNKVDEDLTMVTQRSELLEPLDGTETSLHQSSEPGDVCKQVPETDSSYITNTVELKDQSFEEHTVSQSVDECCDTTQDRLEKVEEDVAVQQPTVTNDNHQEASQAECTPLPGTTEQVTPDEDSDIVPVTERSESQDTTMHLAVEESELGSCQLCPEKEE